MSCGKYGAHWLWQGLAPAGVGWVAGWLACAATRTPLANMCGHVTVGAAAGCVLGASLVALGLRERPVSWRLSCLAALGYPVAGLAVMQWGQVWLIGLPVPDWLVALGYGCATGVIAGMVYQLLIFRARDRPSAVALAVLALAVILGAQGAMVLSRGRRYLHMPSCLSNVKQLGLAMALYAEDYDGRYPPYEEFFLSIGGPPLGSRSAPRTGYLFEYVRVPELWMCDKDTRWRDRLERPRPHGRDIMDSSYRWDAGLAGLRRDDVADPKTAPVLFDMAPRHYDHRNVALADGHAKWLREDDFQTYGVDAR